MENVRYGWQSALTLAGVVAKVYSHKARESMFVLDMHLVLRTAHKVPVHTLMCLTLQSERGIRICAWLH
jgi:hypothetical protein